MFGIFDAIPAVQAIKKGWIIAVWALVVGLGVALTVQSIRLGMCQDDLTRADQTIKEQTGALDLAAGINAGNVTAIRSLQAANAEWAKQATIDKTHLDAAAALVSAAQFDARAARSQASAQLKEERHDPQCDTALSADLGAVCPLLRQRLLDHATKLRTY